MFDLKAMRTGGVVMLATLDKWVHNSDLKQTKVVHGLIRAWSDEELFGFRASPMVNYWFSVGVGEKSAFIRGDNLHHAQLASAPPHEPEYILHSYPTEAQPTSEFDFKQLHDGTGVKMLLQWDEHMGTVDGTNHRTAWGTVRIHKSKDMFGFDLKKASNYYFSVGNGANTIFIAGCQVFAGTMCTKKPTGPLASSVLVLD
jgi:hypothetical protein